MALTKLLAATPENTDPRFAQITVHGEVLEFRRPEPLDFISQEKAVAELAALAPEYEGTQHANVFLLGKCYRSAPDEGEVAPYALFGELETKNPLFFIDLVEAFYGAFPVLVAWLKEKEAAKNASTDGTDTPAASS